MIILEKIKESNLNLIIEWKEKANIIKNNQKVFKTTLKNQQQWLEKIRNDDSCKYWLINNCGIKIGIIDLNHIDYENKICNLEYYIGDLHFRGRKITPIILYNMYNYVFEEMKLKKILIYVMNFNDYEISNFLNTGCEMKHLTKEENENERNFNVVCLSITDEQWKVVKERTNFQKIEIE